MSTTAAVEDDWEFAISPLFLWGVSIEGDATIDGNVAPLDLSFKDDVLKNVETVFTQHFEARKGDWTFFTEYQYVDLDPDIQASIGTLLVDADVGFKESMWEIGGGYLMAGWFVTGDSWGCNPQWGVLAAPASTGGLSVELFGRLSHTRGQDDVNGWNDYASTTLGANLWYRSIRGSVNVL